MGVGMGAAGAVSADVGAVMLGCAAVGSPSERQGMKVPVEGKGKTNQGPCRSAARNRCENSCLSVCAAVVVCVCVCL
jgi:hypothetical protein